MISAQQSIQRPEYTLEISYDSKAARTQAYPPQLCVLRRGTHIAYRLQALKMKVDHKKLGLELTTKSRGQDTKYAIKPGKGHKTYFDCVSESSSKDVFMVVLKTTTGTPVGLYHVCITQGGKVLTESLPLFIIFNAHDPSDDVYCADHETLEEYLSRTTTKVHFGDDSHQAHRTYQLSQHTMECISCSNIYLNQMDIADRVSPVHTSRKITSFVNSNDDNGLVASNWGEITSGKPSTHWTDMHEIYAEYLKYMRPAQWAQCFVYAGLTASLCRCIGMLSRIVTGFSIGHDDNQDGVLSVYVLEDTLETLNRTFHSWNNVYMKRKDIMSIKSEGKTIVPHGWQHIDGTPQERSKGTFQCGPFPLAFLKAHTFDKKIPFDGFSAYYSMHATVKYIIVKKDRSVVKEVTKDTKRILLTSNHLKSDILITDEYITSKPKPKAVETSKIKAKLIVDKSAPLGKLLSYKAKIENTTELSQTVMCVSLELRNQGGRNLLSKTMEQSHVFTDKGTTIRGEFMVEKDPVAFDLSLATFHWELKILDQKSGKVKIIQKNTSLEPVFKGAVRKVSQERSGPTCKVHATVINQTDLQLNGAKVSVQVGHIAFTLKEQTVSFEPYEAKGFEFDLTGIPQESRKIIVAAKYGISSQEIGSVIHG